MPNYFDFHYHPTFKQFLSDFEEQYPSNRTAADIIPVVTPQNLALRLIDRGILHMIGSQSSLDQMKQGNEIVGVANVVSLEFAFSDATNIFGNLLRDGAAKPLDQQYFDEVRGHTISYFHLFIKELNLYSVLANIGTYKKDGVAPVISVLARSKKDSINFDDCPTPKLALSMEGGHNLNRCFTTLDNALENLDKPALPLPERLDAIYEDFSTHSNTVLTQAQSLTNLFHAMWQEEMDLLYLTLTHLTDISELRLATHAYGMKFLTHPKFSPAGNGLTDNGREVIDAAYTMSIGTRATPVLIDIKHMSVKSRMDFYAYRKQKGYTLPILATHMGVTGYSISEWLSSDAQDIGDGTVRISTKLKQMGLDQPDEFHPNPYYANPWAINLMDEDITEVLKSDGLIGMSFDKRIIGAIASNFNPLNDVPSEFNSPIPYDYMATDEYNYLLANIPSIPYVNAPIPAPDTNLYIDPTWPDADNDLRRDQIRELACLAFNIMHILGVGIRSGVDAWSQIVLGSDYDGLIEPMAMTDFCTYIDGMNVEDVLVKLMPGVESSYLHYHPIGDNVTILPRTAIGDLDDVALRQKIRAIMHDNGVAFIKQWYTDSL